MAAPAAVPEPSSDGKQIRDPIHGDLELARNETRLVDLEVFQRLRRIKQLSSAHLVFPGATHTRFQHSIGTMDVAGRMASRIADLKRDPRRVAQIRLAALLHDLGHGPFSHTSEAIMEGVTRKKIGNVRIASDALALVDPLRKAVGAEFDAVSDLLQREVEGKPKKVGVEYDILDGPIDGDKLDYLLRDSYFCGVPYGHPDALRILHSLRKIVLSATNEDYLGISEKGVEAVQNLQFARYQMHRIVYYHKAKRAADAMLTRAVILAVTEDKTLERNYYDYRPMDLDFLKSYFELDDYTLSRKITEGGKASGALMRRVERRDLFKMAVDLDPSRLTALRYQRLQSMSMEEVGRIEAEIASTVGASPSDIIIDRADIANPAYRGPAEGLNVIKQVMVDSKPLPKFLEEMPGIWTDVGKYIIHSVGVFCPEKFRNPVKEVAPAIIAKP